MTDWDERYRQGSHPENLDPSPVLERHVETFPDGRALDVATGPGRNAVFLAEQGYVVDAVDKSREGLRIARRNAADTGVADRVNPIQADVPSYGFPRAAYEVVTISFYRAVDRFPDIKESLVPGGVLYVQHHLRTSEPTHGGPSDRYRFPANELLHACLDLTVLHYQERAQPREDGGVRATTEIVARNSTGARQSYPEVPQD